MNRKMYICCLFVFWKQNTLGAKYYTRCDPREWHRTVL